MTSVSGAVHLQQDLPTLEHFMPTQSPQSSSGFRLIKKTQLPELNAVLHQFQHQSTGARYVHLATADPNNLFAVGFRTPPEDSTGVAHILEHTVLCGSRRFPVRDPFFSMIKRSLNTFMNAMTSSDWTLYPVASLNPKDFYNLMDIYLDAAFFPLLRARDFRQEGHRLEFAEADNPQAPLVFKGVVYNEMKGAMADPSSLLGRRLNRALYPTITYGHNSGGEPADIPDLTWEGLREFHARCYHPSNAYFFTSGNLPPEKHMQLMEERVLRHFKASAVATEVPAETRFSAPRQLVETFPLDPEEPTLGKSMVQVAWLTCPISDSFERTALAVLSTLLVGNPAAPLYKSLLDSKLGQNLAPGTGYHDDNRDTFFAAGLQGTNPEAAGQIEALVIATLEEAARTGFSEERIEAAMHQLEFAHREVSGDQYPYSLLLLMRLFGPWLHNDDPVAGLTLEQDMTRLRLELQQGPILQTLLRKHFLDNPHRVTLTLRPDPTQKAREEAASAARLESIKAGLSPADAQRLLDQARELQLAQETEEDLSCLPTLELSDIPVAEEPVPARESSCAGRVIEWYDQPTNGIGYLNLHFNAAALPQELQIYLPLFCSTLTQVGAAGYSYLEMAERKTAATGGIRAIASVLENPQTGDSFQALVELRGKALLRNQQKMFAIFTDICLAPDFTDLERLHTLIAQIKTGLENSIPGSGHSYAARTAAARLTAGARLRESWTGLEQVRFVKSLAALKPQELADTAQKLAGIAKTLLSRSSLRAAVVAEAANHPTIEPLLEAFLQALPAAAPAQTQPPPPFVATPRRLGWATSVPVSYVARVFPIGPFTDPDSALLLVLAKLLRAGYLHREIREKGGAYGGMASCDPEAGIFCLLSYRDPQLVRTLNVYRDAVDWATSGGFSVTEIKEAILAVFGDLDRPISPASKGLREFACRQQRLTLEMRQALRGRVLAADRASLQRVAEKYLDQGWNRSAVGVVAGEDALRQANLELPELQLAVERI